MSRKSSIRIMLSHDGNPHRTRPPIHKTSYSLSSLTSVGKSILDASLLNSSLASVDEDSQNEDLPGRLSDKLPLISRSKRALTDSDTGLRPVVLKRRTPDFQRSIKDLRLNLSLSKSKRPFAGLIPLGGFRKLEDILPIQRWKKTPPIGITVMPADPESAKRDSSPFARDISPVPRQSSPVPSNTLQLSPSDTPQRKVRRPSKLRELSKLGQSLDHALLASSDSSFELLPGATPFSEVIEKEIDTKGAYPYLASKPRASKIWQQLPTPQATKRKEEKTGRSSCTCSLKLYLTTSLHYQQLFLRVAPSSANLQHFASPVLLYMSRPEWESRGLVVTIVFDGVLGDWGKRCLTDHSAFFLRIRCEAVTGLALLQQNFRLVLVSRMPKKLCLHALGYFRSRNVFFEAAYRLGARANTPESRFHQFLVYEKIEKDLGLVHPSRSMLVLSALNLSHDELETPSPELLYSKRGTKFCLNADYLPIAVPAPEGVPVTCLVPGMQSQEYGRVLGFADVARAIIAFHARGGEDWVACFYAEHESSDFFLFSTTAVHQVLMSHILPEPRSDCFLADALPSHTCNLHSRLAWGKGPSIHPFTSKLMLLTTVPQSSDSPGFEIIETKTQVLRSGFVSLLDYVMSTGPKACQQ